MASAISGPSRREYTFAELESSGNTTNYLPVNENNTHTVGVEITNASTGLRVRIEGSMDGTYWFNLDTSSNTGDGSGNLAGVVRGNGRYFWTFPNRRIRYIRGKWVTGTIPGGGYGAKVKFTYMGG